MNSLSLKSSASVCFLLVKADKSTYIWSFRSAVINYIFSKLTLAIIVFEVNAGLDIMWCQVFEVRFACITYQPSHERQSTRLDYSYGVTLR